MKQRCDRVYSFEFTFNFHFQKCMFIIRCNPPLAVQKYTNTHRIAIIYYPVGPELLVWFSVYCIQTK